MEVPAGYSKVLPIPNVKDLRKSSASSSHSTAQGPGSPGGEGAVIEMLQRDVANLRVAMVEEAHESRLATHCQ